MKSSKKFRKTSSLDLNLTSMIDVIFLLLIFFVFTSDFKEPEKLLPTNLSAPGSVASAATLSQEARDLGKITIRIAVAGDEIVWSVDGRRAESFEAVEATLVALQEIDPNVPVVVDPDRAVPIEKVLDAYDAARRAGLSKIKFAASPDALARAK